MMLLALAVAVYLLALVVMPVWAAIVIRNGGWDTPSVIERWQQAQEERRFRRYTLARARHRTAA